jgi:hypothetical protein
MLMNVSVSIVASVAVVLNNSMAIAAEIESSAVTISQTTVIVSTDADGGQVQSTSVSIDRADLAQPYILRVQGLANDAPIRLQRVEVKVNGKVVRSIANSSLVLNLAPMLKSGRNEVEISGSSPRTEDTIVVSFSGKNTNVTQQFAGTGILKQILAIDIQ